MQPISQIKLPPPSQPLVYLLAQIVRMNREAKERDAKLQQKK